MRASSLSNRTVIDLINGHFVAVHLRNQDFGEQGTASAEEKTLKQRIYRDALAAKLSAGTVCVYLLSPEGKPLATAPLNQPAATDPKQLATLLQQVIDQLQLTKAAPVITPAPPAPPDCDADGLVVQLTARYLEGRGANARPLNTQAVLGSQKGGNWGDLPSQVWVVLSRDEWTKLLPADPARGSLNVGSTWMIDPTVADKLLVHFYPPTESTDNRKNRIDERSLTARVESMVGGRICARLKGQLLMKHPFYHKDDNNFVTAPLLGYLEFEPATSTRPIARIHQLLLVTDDAQYGDLSKRPHSFGVAATLAQ